MYLFTITAWAYWLSVATAFGIPSMPAVIRTSPNSIQNSYIVVYKPGVTNTQAAAHEALINASTESRNSTLSGIGDTFDVADLKAYTVETDKIGLQQIATSGLVALIEQDGIVNATSYVQQQNAPWGLQRVSHRFSGYSTYVYDNSAGAGTYAYVLDTGILTTHSDFGGRASWGINFVTGSPNTDENGHGTHCAGTIGGASFGVAKSTNLVAVKVLDKSGGGSYSNVIAALQWVAADVISKGRTGKAVASMSLSGGYSAAVNAAVNALYAAGIPVVVAAGNNGADAKSYSPGSAQYAITVGATDQSDSRPSWSNYGSIVNLFAPGVSVMSDWNTCATCVNTISGTSMATPHVAGMSVYLMAKEGLKRPADILRRLKYLAIANTVKNSGTGTVPLLLFNGNGDNGGN